MDDPDPSDVDLLAVFDADDPEKVHSRDLEVTETLGLAEMRHLWTPREVNFLFSSRSTRE